MNVSNTATNASDSSLPDDISYWEQILVAVFLGLVAIAGLVGNSMIITAVAFSRKLQTSTNAFVTSLSTADLLTCFTLIWYTVGSLGKNEWPIPGAYWICQLTGYLVYAYVGTSVWTLGIIAIDRLIHITKPMWYKKIFTYWKLVILVVLPWVIPPASLLIPLATGHVAYGYDKTRQVCADNQTTAFVLILGVIGTIPLLAIVGSYIRIYVYVKKHFQETLAITEEGHDPNSSFAVRRREQITKQEIEITKNLFVVVVGFLACFLPYFIIRSIPNTTIQHIEFYVKIIPFASSIINFIIYAMKHPDFKVVLRHMMRFSYADIPQPSRILKYLLRNKREARPWKSSDHSTYTKKMTTKL